MLRPFLFYWRMYPVFGMRDGGKNPPGLFFWRFNAFGQNYTS